MAAHWRSTATNIADLFMQSAALHPLKPALRRRVGGEFSRLTYGETREMVLDLAAGLSLLGLSRGDRVALISENWDRWLVADLAVLACGAVDVPRPSQSPPAELAEVLRHAGCRFALVAGPEELQLLRQVRRQLPDLQVVVDLSDGNDPLRQARGFSAVSAAGRRARLSGTWQRPLPDPAVGRDHLATLVYTSGTTGKPKGVMLSHGNILANVEGIHRALHIGAGEVVLSILPTWHMYERTVEYATLAGGGEIVYTTLRTVQEDLRLVRPTFFASVPRLWSRIYETTCERLAASRGIKGALGRLAWNAGHRAVAARKVLAGEPDPGGGPPRPGPLRAAMDYALCAPVHKILGQGMVFRPVRQATGGRLRGALSGGAGLPADLDLFFEMAGVKLLNGYGLTETAPVLTCRRFERNTAGTAGLPLPGTEIRIVDDQRREVPAGTPGRILARGPQVMTGYYQDPGATAKVLDAEGWLLTGDLGRLLPDGDLVVSGREKDTIVLASGENVEPEELEERLQTSRYIDQLMLVGQDQEFLAALVVPALGPLKVWCLQQGLGVRDEAEMISSRQVLALYREEIRRLAPAGGRAARAIRRFQLLTEPFSVETGTLTRTLKIRRPAVLGRYSQEIEAMFRRHAAA